MILPGAPLHGVSLLVSLMDDRSRVFLDGMSLGGMDLLHPIEPAKFF